MIRHLAAWALYYVQPLERPVGKPAALYHHRSPARARRNAA